jgi:hypothetical protein
MAALALAIGWGRAGFGPGMGLSKRYVTLAVPMLCAAYLASVLYDQPVFGRLVRVGLCLATLGMLWSNTRQALYYGQGLRQIMSQFKADIHALPPMALVDFYARTPIAPYPLNTSDWQGYLTMLKRARLDPFTHMPEDPAYRTVPLNDDNAVHTSVNTWVLKEPSFVYGVRVTYSFSPMAPFANFQLTWTTPRLNQPGLTERGFRRGVPQHPGSDSVLFWVNAPVHQLSVAPDDKPYSCQLLSVELLVPKA